MKQIVLTIAVLFTAFITPTKAQGPGAKKDFNQVLKSYFDTKNALAKDDAVLANSAAEKLIESINALKVNGLTAEQQIAWKKQSLELKTFIEPVVADKALKTQRKSFEKVASAMIKLAKTINLNNSDIYIQYCPMVKRSWLNDVKAVQNPFYGSKMYDCGEVTETIAKK
ncbi:MAG: DUF3347 domain-containing protein [Bacteroidota bacterium]